jgi:hypothetical protein
VILLLDGSCRLAFQSSVDVGSLIQGLVQGQYGRGWSAITSSTAGDAAAVERTWGYDPFERHHRGIGAAVAVARSLPQPAGQFVGVLPRSHVSDKMLAG